MSCFNKLMLKNFAMSARRKLVADISIKSYELGLFYNRLTIEKVAYFLFSRIISLRFMEVNGYLNLPIKSNDMFLERCEFLHNIMPQAFDEVTILVRLLLPVDAYNLVYSINSSVFLDNVTVIGWLYQYYNTEKRNSIAFRDVVRKDTLPLVTQIFTDEWVVCYMVDNSLGRYWIERNPCSKLRDKLQYFVGSVEYIDEKISPKDIKFFDPCVGSGHILAYAFDVFMEIYLECGYIACDIPKLILKNNLFGLDIDDKVVKLTHFVMTMKAKKFSSRYIAVDNVYSMVDNFNTKYCNIYFGDNEDISYLTSLFKDSKEYGSILNIDRQIDYDNYINSIDDTSVDSRIIVNMLYVAKVLDGKYEIVVTNPPYLNKMDVSLKNYIHANYRLYASDLFSVFIYKNLKFCKADGYCAFMTPFVWMFIKSYEKLRSYIINEKHISSLIQLEYSAFEEATVPICTFVLKNVKINAEGYYIKLSQFKGNMEAQRLKVLDAINNFNCGYLYKISSDNFTKLPRSPISYWVSERFLRIFNNNTFLSDIADPKQGLATADNKRFVRKWFEVDYTEIYKKWFPYNNGGGFRKWFGLNTDVVNWENNGFDIKNYKNSAVRNERNYFSGGITWNAITSNDFSARYFPEGFIFSNAGMAIFCDEENIYLLLAYINSSVIKAILKIISPTLNYNQGDICNIPIIFDLSKNNLITKISKENIFISKTDWDNFEISWDFKKHPFIKFNFGDNKIKDIFERWKIFSERQFNSLKQNEETLNRLIINIYDLEGEVVPDVLDKDISIRKADDVRDVKSFISYAVGCMFGRYSLDVEGIVYAGGRFFDKWQIENGKSKVWDEKTLTYKLSTFDLTEDNVLVVTKNDFFDNDVVARFIDFVRIVYGDSTLKENLKFIADTIYPNLNRGFKEKIRRYFFKDFFRDHMKIYHNKPIYWQIGDSTLLRKQTVFKVLVYIHRCDKHTIDCIRLNYLDLLRKKYELEIKSIMDNVLLREKNKYKKRISNLREKLSECYIYDKILDNMLHRTVHFENS